MKSRILAAIVLVGILAVLVITRPWSKLSQTGPSAAGVKEAAQQEAPGEGPAGIEGKRAVAQVPPPPPPVAPPPSEIRAMIEKKPLEAPPEEAEPQTREIQPNVTLATVNNVPITLKDLVHIREENKNQPVKMAADEYVARLNRAIETELTYQAAQAQGVTLTGEQLVTVQSLRNRALADIAAYRAQGMMWTSVSEEQMAFTERYVSALLLQQNLLAKQGLPATPTLTEDQIQQYYQANKQEYGPLPADPAAREAAWNDIRNKIVDTIWPYLQKKYEDLSRQYLQQLRDNANVQIPSPPA